MKKKFALLVLFLHFLEAPLIVKAQAQVAFKEKGSIINEKEDGNTIQGITATQANGFKNAILKLRSIVLETPLLQPPKGYNVYSSYFIHQGKNFDLPWLKSADANVSFALAPLYFEKTKLLDSRESGSAVSVYVNNFREIIRSPYTSALSEVNYPEPAFFFLDGVEIDSADSRNIIITFPTAHPVHVITNGKKLFIPFTQEQYMHFKILRDQKTLQDAKKSYDFDNQNLHSIKKEFTDLSKKRSLTDFEKTRFTIDSFSSKTIQKIVDADEQTVNVLKDRLKSNQAQLGLIDKKDPAFVDMENGDIFKDDLFCPDLADKNDPRKIELWTINPGYINKELPQSAIQIITVSFAYHPTITVDYMKKIAIDMVEAIDYGKLKRLIEK